MAVGDSGPQVARFGLFQDPAWHAIVEAHVEYDPGPDFMTDPGGLRVVPLASERWPDLEALFGRSGASYGCWCMFFRRSSSEMAKATAADNRAGLRALSDAEPAPGLLAYDGEEPVGWVGLGPRSGFERLVRSRFLAPVDELPAWSIVCFYVARGRRGQGIGRALLAGAVE